jgi:hypothetical protein
VNKRRRTLPKNIEHSRDGLSITSFGTRGSQVQILPLRPAFSHTRSFRGMDMGHEILARFSFRAREFRNWNADCGSGGRRFESTQPYHIIYENIVKHRIISLMDCPIRWAPVLRNHPGTTVAGSLCPAQISEIVDFLGQTPRSTTLPRSGSRVRIPSPAPQIPFLPKGFDRSVYDAFGKYRQNETRSSPPIRGKSGDFVHAAFRVKIHACSPSNRPQNPAAPFPQLEWCNDRNR